MRRRATPTSSSVTICSGAQLILSTSNLFECSCSFRRQREDISTLFFTLRVIDNPPTRLQAPAQTSQHVRRPCCATEVSPEASSPDPQMLPSFSEKRPGYEAEFERAQLHALLCKHEEEQATESGGLLGEEGYCRCLQGKNRVRRLKKSINASQLDAMRLTDMGTATYRSHS